jgi:retron-type reverse transcriptase
MLRPYARIMYAQIHSWENLYLAYRQASKGKRGHANVAAFEHHLEDNLLALQAELATKTYQPGAYTSFYIHEPKKRLISAAPFRDRVVHHALCNLIEPIFERSFIFDSYANRVGKGTHRALNRCQEFARRYKYVLQIDLEQFFPSIDHAILREILARKIHDENVLWLIDQVLAGGRGVLADEYTMRYFAEDDLFAVHRPRGLPIGNLTSQFWANCLLNPFDHFVKRELGCRAYVRYVDDMLLFANERETLWAWRADIIERLARMRLTIHTASAQVKPVTHGIPFLGFVVYPTHRLLKRRKGITFARRMRARARHLSALRAAYAPLTAMVRGWINHTRYADTRGLRRAVLGRRIARVGMGVEL